MWTFENAPLDYFDEQYGFRPTQKWLDRVRLASLRFGGGCSASFVSPRGLILTNHHCARDKVAEVSPPDEDWLGDGHFATGLDSEAKIPGLTVQQLVEMRDVTSEMTRDDDLEGNERSVVASAREEHSGRRLRLDR